jgi:hypothetical protein
MRRVEKGGRDGAGWGKRDMMPPGAYATRVLLRCWLVTIHHHHQFLVETLTPGPSLTLRRKSEDRASSSALVYSMEMSHTEPESEDTPFFSQILKPGSSLHPTFLLIVDCAFLLLLLVFIALIFITGGNLHVFALIAIELGLWGSVKWCV